MAADHKIPLVYNYLWFRCKSTDDALHVYGRMPIGCDDVCTNTAHDGEGSSDFMGSYNQTASPEEGVVFLLPGGGVAVEDAGPDEDSITTYPVWASFNVLITLTGGLANSLLILLSLQRSQLVTPLTQLLVAQCVLNLSDCALGVPLNAFLVGTGIVFDGRDALCRVVLSWLYATWSNFCFSLLLISSLRLLYVAAPLRMHRVRNRTVVWTGCVLLVVSQLAWLVSSLLMEEQPFGSALCMTGRYWPSSSRILASLVFNLWCILLTFAFYISLALTCPGTLAPASTTRHRNIITARTGLIQCVFLLLTFLMPILTRVASYRGLISPTQLSRGNMFFIKISQVGSSHVESSQLEARPSCLTLVVIPQCSVYPVITIVCSSVLRREAWKMLEPLRTFFYGRRGTQPAIFLSAIFSNKSNMVEPAVAFSRFKRNSADQGKEPAGREARVLKKTTVSILFTREFLKPLPVGKGLQSSLVSSPHTSPTLTPETGTTP
ncbi:uncharacterized protein [Panulirus ornatus]|uniref:uncharacterized protein n=1 Tax=Panulirus ornatus TaxID=150431 RepID=UPI003A857BBC